MSPDFSNPMTFYLQSQLKTQDVFHDLVNTKNYAARCILGRITTITDTSTNGELFLINFSEKNCSRLVLLLLLD